MQQGVRIGRAARDKDIHLDNTVDSADRCIVSPEDAATAATSAHSRHEAGFGSGVIGFAQRQFHIATDGAGDQQHVGMTRGGDEMNAKAFQVVNGIIQADDFDFAPVARTCIHFADMQ